MVSILRGGTGGENRETNRLEAFSDGVIATLALLYALPSHAAE